MTTIKTIKIDTDKCTGCRTCEVLCSAFHAEPKYSIVNPKRSRIRVFWDEENDQDEKSEEKKKRRTYKRTSTPDITDGITKRQSRELWINFMNLQNY